VPEYRLLQHKDFERSLRGLPPTTQRKTVWAQVLLGTRGRTPNVKGTMGRNARWRRTPVQGNHYYMWWIPQSESLLSDASNGTDTANDINGSHGANGTPTSTGGADLVNTILVHSVRHHDETDQPIQVGDLSEYQTIRVDSLDPRYEEQREISEYLEAADVSVATIKGLPGSGKTIALLYLLKDLLALAGDGQILYVTYTPRLKRAALEFIESQYAGDHGEILKRVRIATLNEIMRDMTGVFTYAEPFAELDEFYTFIERQNPADLGPWRKYPRTLFTEIRAYLLGQDFPDGYDWAQENRGGGGIDVVEYAEERGIDLEAAEIASRMAERVRHMRFFRDQAAAHRALAQLIKGKTPPWLAKLDALVVDEVQDLTLLQIAFLSEMVRARTRIDSKRPMRFAVAGDESQIVQPSGFDWGMTKYMLGEQLEVWPDEFNFEYQRRSPDNLADLIDSSWSFYARLPKQLRPSARSQRAIADPAADGVNQGRILLTPVPSAAATSVELAALKQQFIAAERTLPAFFDDELPQADQLWAALLTEISERPGRALVDLTEQLRSESHSNAVEGADEIIFLPREIKGLERSTILIHGLDDAYQRAIARCEDSGDGNIPRFEARRLFDEIRVALSRSTDNLVLLERSDAPVLQALAIEYVDGCVEMGWADLVETLQTEEMSELEAVEGYLREVEDLFERDKWDQAFARNRRAYAMAMRMADRALQREADVQYASGILLQADTFLYRNRWREAHDRNREARDFAANLNDSTLWRRIDEQRDLIVQEATGQVRTFLDAAEEERRQKQFDQAYEHAKLAYDLGVVVMDATIRQNVSDAIGDICWQWAGHLIDTSQSEETGRRVAELLDESARIMESEGNRGGAEGLRILSRRYASLPLRDDLNDEQVLALLGLARDYVDVVSPLQPDRSAYAYVQRWLTDAFANLGERFTLYYAWASAAELIGNLIDDPSYQARVVQLERRLDTILDRAGQLGSLWDGDEDLARFRALAAGVHGRHEQSSLAWEEMGDLLRAAEQARAAGNMERAYQLLRTAHAPISEDLATTIKFLRLLEQIELKGYDYSETSARCWSIGWTGCAHCLKLAMRSIGL
jgi:hypothetical protein